MEVQADERSGRGCFEPTSEIGLGNRDDLHRLKIRSLSRPDLCHLPALQPRSHLVPATVPDTLDIRGSEIRGKVSGETLISNPTDRRHSDQCGLLVEN